MRSGLQGPRAAERVHRIHPDRPPPRGQGGRIIRQSKFYPTKSPGEMPGLFCEAALKYRDVFQQRDHAEDDHDDAANLLGAAVERQHVDEIEDEDNDEKRDEYADKHAGPLRRESAVSVLLTWQSAPGSGPGTSARGSKISII